MRITTRNCLALSKQTESFYMLHLLMVPRLSCLVFLKAFLVPRGNYPRDLVAVFHGNGTSVMLLLSVQILVPPLSLLAFNTLAVVRVPLEERR